MEFLTESCSGLKDFFWLAVQRVSSRVVGKTKLVAQSVALSRNGYWTQRLGVVFKDCHLISFSKLGFTSLRSSGLLRYHHPLGNVFRT